MSNSCGGLDASVQDEVEAGLKSYIRRKKPRKYLDQTDEGGGRYACLLEDCDGVRCPDGTCHYSGGKLKENHESDNPINP